jgi:hypothetical protein
MSARFRCRDIKARLNASFARDWDLFGIDVPIFAFVALKSFIPAL